jgi:hypothetical protein
MANIETRKLWNYENSSSRVARAEGFVVLG